MPTPNTSTVPPSPRDYGWYNGQPGKITVLVVAALVLVPSASAQQQSSTESRICTSVSADPLTAGAGIGFAACCPMGYEVVIDMTRQYRCALTREITNLDGEPIPRVTRRQR